MEDAARSYGIAESRPTTLTEITEQMLRCKLVTMSVMIQFQAKYKQLEELLERSIGQEDSIAAINVFLIYHVQLLGVARINSHNSIADLQHMINLPIFPRINR